MKKLRVLSLVVALAFLTGGVWWWLAERPAPADPSLPAVTTSPPNDISTVKPASETTATPAPIASTAPPLQSVFWDDVPFVAQAPYGEWDDPRQQDGCEEASVLMAVRWARNQQLTRRDAKAEILAMADWQKERYGTFRDTSAEDTAERLVRGYLNFSDVEVRHAIEPADIASALTEGVVVVPMDGQKLGNPHFSPPGPERHMLVVTGYDAEQDEFITNDPGTRHGEHFRYSATVIGNALLDYPTGYHEPITEHQTALILVKRH